MLATRGRKKPKKPKKPKKRKRMALVFKTWEKRASSKAGDPVGSPWHVEVGWLFDDVTGEVHRIRYRGTDVLDFNGQHPPRVRFHSNPPDVEEFLLRSTPTDVWLEENIPPPRRFSLTKEVNELGEYWRGPPDLDAEFDYEWL